MMIGLMMIGMLANLASISLKTPPMMWPPAVAVPTEIFMKKEVNKNEGC